MFNENLFRKKLIDLNISIRELSKAIGINEATFHRKIKGITDFSRNEMSIIKMDKVAPAVVAKYLGMPYAQLTLVII